MAMLAKAGPDEALSRVQESMPGADLAARLAAVRATGHPDAAELARAVAEFDRSGVPGYPSTNLQLNYRSRPDRVRIRVLSM